MNADQRTRTVLQTYEFCEHTMQHPAGESLQQFPLVSFKGVASWRWGKGTRRGTGR